MKTEKQAREYCRKYKLATNGKKPEMVKRIKEYTLRFNAQIDQDRQKSGGEIRFKYITVVMFSTSGYVAIFCSL